jgi:hypothetical protein
MTLLLVLLATIRAAVALHPAPTLLPRPCSCRQQPPHPASSASAGDRRLGHQVHPSHHAPRDRRARAPPTPPATATAGAAPAPTPTPLSPTPRPTSPNPAAPPSPALPTKGTRPEQAWRSPRGSIFNRWKGVNFQPLLTLPCPLDERLDREALNRKPDQAVERPSDPGSLCIAGPHQSTQCGQHLGIEVSGCRERGPTHPGCHRIATVRSAQHLDHDRCVDHEQLRAHATSMSRRPSATKVTLSGPSLGSGGSARTSSSHSSRVGRAAWRCRTSTT